MSGSLEDLCAETPDSGHGLASGYGTWKLIVEAAIPNQAHGLWGVDTWGHGTWSDGYEWRDLAASFRGASWTRGRDGIQGRPETGEASLALANNTGTYSYWNTGSTYPSAPYSLLPGTLVRLGWYDGSSWQPAFTGLLDEAEESGAERDGDLWITWHLVETTAALSLLDGLELPEAGAGETGEERMDRLLDEAGWSYGTAPAYGHGGFFTPWTTETLQATTLAGNRLAECYLTADSVFADVYSDRAGRIQFLTKDSVRLATAWDNGSGTAYGVSEDGGLVSSVRYVPWTDAPGIRTSNLDRYDQVTVGRANGTDSATAVLPGTPVRSSYKRTDLIMDSDTNLGEWAADWLGLFAGNLVKVGSVGIDARQDSNSMPAIAHLDAPLTAKLRRTNPRQATGYTDTTFSAVLTGYAVDVTPNGAQALSVHASLSVAVYAIA